LTRPLPTKDGGTLRTIHAAHHSGCVRLYGRDRQGARATLALAAGTPTNPRGSRRSSRQL